MSSRATRARGGARSAQQRRDAFARALLASPSRPEPSCKAASQARRAICSSLRPSVPAKRRESRTCCESSRSAGQSPQLSQDLLRRPPRGRRAPAPPLRLATPQRPPRRLASSPLPLPCPLSPCPALPGTIHDRFPFDRPHHARAETSQPLTAPDPTTARLPPLARAASRRQSPAPSSKRHHHPQPAFLLDQQGSFLRLNRLVGSKVRLVCCSGSSTSSRPRADPPLRRLSSSTSSAAPLLAPLGPHSSRPARPRPRPCGPSLSRPSARSAPSPALP